MKGHKGHHHKGHKAGGGRTGLVASGNPDVIKEAKGEEPYSKDDEKKHGGKVDAKPPMLMAGGGVRPRLDRPGRKMGGRVGADRSPLSSAHKSGSPESLPKSQDGGMST